MKFLSRLVAALAIIVSTNSYCAEEKPASSYLNSAWSYVTDLGNYLSNWYEWLTSFLVDHRTTTEKISDDTANDTYFDHEVESADALITHAEELHTQVLSTGKKNLNEETKAKIRNYITSLEARRENLALVQARISPDYVQEAGQGIIENFKGVKSFNPLDVYPFLAQQFTNQRLIAIAEPTAEQSKNKSVTQVEKLKKEAIKAAGDTIRTTFSAQKIAHQLNTLIADLQKQKQTNDLLLLRQILFLFRNENSKKQFDAFLLDGNEGGLFSLQITDADGSKMTLLQELMSRLQMVKAELQNDLR